MPNILLVDDMDNVRQAIASVLKKQGHQVVEANDCQKALEALKRHTPDLVITDIMMPESDGTDLIITLKEKTDTPPVIAISGGGSGIPAENALSVARQKADATLIKPFENEELIRLVNSLL